MVWRDGGIFSFFLSFFFPFFLSSFLSLFSFPLEHNRSHLSVWRRRKNAICTYISAARTLLVERVSYWLTMLIWPRYLVVPVYYPAVSKFWIGLVFSSSHTIFPIGPLLFFVRELSLLCSNRFLSHHPTIPPSIRLLVPGFVLSQPPPPSPRTNNLKISYLHTIKSQSHSQSPNPLNPRDTTPSSFLPSSPSFSLSLILLLTLLHRQREREKQKRKYGDCSPCFFLGSSNGKKKKKLKTEGTSPDPSLDLDLKGEGLD